MNPAGGFLRLHNFLPASLANGPGRRAVVWVQGCTLGCPGCFNPETHPSAGGQVKVTDLAGRIAALAGGLDGLTVSGGEPLQQLPALISLLRAVRLQTNLSILLFTGYTWPEIQRMPASVELLVNVDVLLAGRYDSTRRVAAGLIGSSNKTIHFLTSRHTAADFVAIPQAEVILDLDGNQFYSGIDPLRG